MIEKTYTVPLRKEWLKTVKYKRAKKTVTAVREFLTRHLKSEDVRLGKHLNLEIWKHGIKNPPSRIRITAKKDDKGVVRAELFGAPVEKPVEVAEKGKEAEKKSEITPAEKTVVQDAVIVKEEKTSEEKKPAEKVTAQKKPRAKKAVEKNENTPASSPEIEKK